MATKTKTVALSATTIWTRSSTSDRCRTRPKTPIVTSMRISSSAPDAASRVDLVLLLTGSQVLRRLPDGTSHLGLCSTQMSIE
jgi:hypothetical protein